MKLPEKIWYHHHPLRWALWPFSWLYRLVTGLRRLSFRCHLSKTYTSSVPVIIVGNIHVGGVGKTPLILKLIQYFQNNDLNVGVVSRGYGATLNSYPHEVTLESAAGSVGDEPSMIKQLTGVPVVIAPERPKAVQYLLSHYTLDVILSDDGLQHYALGRDIEIVVMDAERLGNGMCLPAGPLRESWSRLEQADFIVANNANAHNIRLIKSTKPIFSAILQPQFWLNVHTGEQREIGCFRGHKANAIAGIGHPERFFKTCKELGILISPYEYPDHYCYNKADFKDFSQEVLLLMTEKDAVKCKAWSHANTWALHVELELDSEQDFFQRLSGQLAF